MISYGPFHRKNSPTQDYVTAQLQLRSNEIWGKAVKNGGKYACVKAYEKPLCYGMPANSDCVDCEGIEFTTLVKPSARSPSGQIFWQIGHRAIAGLREVDDETIALTATILKVVYSEASSE